MSAVKARVHTQQNLTARSVEPLNRSNIIWSLETPYCRLLQNVLTGYDVVLTERRRTFDNIAEEDFSSSQNDARDNMGMCWELFCDRGVKAFAPNEIDMVVNHITNSVQ